MRPTLELFGELLDRGGILGGQKIEGKAFTV
jgi:hypothetical protein